jgi:hypothetical protein
MNHSQRERVVNVIANVGIEHQWYGSIAGRPGWLGTGRKAYS